MRMLVGILAALAILPAPALAQSSASGADGILGVWLTAEGKAHVEVYRCGEEYCGKIIWLKEPLKNGKPALDDKNPVDSLRTRPVVGLVIMHSFSYDGDGKYTGGKVYDPESGDDYSGKLTLVDESTLDMRGYILVPLFGRTERWTRYRPAN